MFTINQKNRDIIINTDLGKDKLGVRSMTVSEELSRLFSIELELFSKVENIKFEDLLGTNSTVMIKTHKGTERFFNGYVHHFSQTMNSGDYANYRMVLKPWLWFLTRTSNCRIHQNKKVPDLIKEMLKKYDYTDIEERLSGNYKEWEYCVQYRETDFNFISRLLEQEGIYFYFKHENGKHTLVLSDSYGSHKPIPDYEKIPFSPPDDTAVQDEEHVSSWVISKNIQPSRYALNDFDFKKPKTDLAANASIKKNHKADDFEIYDYPGEYLSTGAGDDYSRIRIEELHSQYETAQASSDARGLLSGGLFTLTQYPRKDQNREYLITAIQHQITVDDMRSSGGGGTSYQNSFSAITSNTPFRSARTTPKPMVQGPQTAIVVGKKGEEIWTDEFGRVKVKFHWDRYSKADENSSCWIRVAQTWAGKKWGAMYIPRIGHEVLVEFLEGDPDRPIITGRVYNGDNMPPYGLPDKKTVSTIKTNSSKGGQGSNEIRFEDKKGEEQLFIQAQKDKDVRVKKKSREWIGTSRHLIVNASQYENVAGEKHLSIKQDQLEQIDGDKHQSITGDHNEKIGGTQSVDIAMDKQEKVGSKHALDAGMEIHLKAGMNVVIEAGMMITLKAGGGFITIGPAGVAISGTPILINSGGSAGSGSGSSPDTPKEPKKPQAADEAEAGQIAETTTPKEPKKSAPSSSVQVEVLKQAAKDGTPFCEKCQKG